MACLAAVLYCMMQYNADSHFVAGVNRWLKPMKFFLSAAIFSASMGWYLQHLDRPRFSRRFSLLLVIAFSFELLVITWQAYHGRLSHFNETTPFYRSLSNALGIVMVLLTGSTAYVAFLFFRKKDFSLPASYIWGIRLGLLLFILFSLEGGLMFARLSHTVGGPDGSPGLPFLNWSRYHGDLRVAHFFGIHALQILPLLGWYSTRSVKAVWLFSGLYLIMVSLLLWQAWQAIPFI